MSFSISKSQTTTCTVLYARHMVVSLIMCVVDTIVFFALHVAALALVLASNVGFLA